MAYKILTGDALTHLRTLRDQTIHTCITSPPYFGLRDYGQRNQIGLEASPAEYVEKLVTVFREVRRALRDDGTLWLNLGDSYSHGGNGARDAERWPKQSRNDHRVEHPNKVYGLAPKQLLGIPWRVAFALQQDGWYLRQDIIWHKPNPMPESVRDRCTKAHEYLFLLSKSPTYYFDSEAMQEPATSGRADMATKGLRTGMAYMNGNINNSVKPGRASGNKSHKYVAEYEGSKTEEHRTKAGLMKIAGTAYETRNRRSVWTVPTKPFREAHFATFSPDLIRPCVLAGSPINGVVLDPFSGAATTGLVALEYGRHFVGIELNPEYVAMSEKRLAGTTPFPPRSPSPLLQQELPQ